VYDTPGEVLQRLGEVVDGIQPPWADTVPDLRGYLLEVRSALDTLLDLRRQAESKASASAVLAERAEADKQDAWDTAAREIGQRREYDRLSWAERGAMYNLRCLDQLKAARDASSAQELWRGCARQVSAAYTHVDGLRHDVHILIKAVQFESSLER